MASKLEGMAKVQRYANDNISKQDLEESWKLIKLSADDKRRREYSLTESQQATQSEVFTKIARRLRNENKDRYPHE